MSAFGSSTLAALCMLSKTTCNVMTPMVLSFYSKINNDTAKLKDDKSVFTIADGLVQHLLVNHLFRDKFKDVVGEEDETNVNIVTKPYTVDDLLVPEEFYDNIDQVRADIDELYTQIDPTAYKDISVFIDPIDGTREFSTNLGEQCSICIGFSDLTGIPVAGLVYRPIPQPPTWAAGVPGEQWTASELDMATTPKPNGLMTSNGSISKFIERLMVELEFERVPSGGAGNKMLMLLEGKGGAYIQDRGVSRWDTCGAQAVIAAHGGHLGKLSSFISNNGAIESYTYLKSDVNLDFVPGLANLTPYNTVDKSLCKKGEIVVADTVDKVKAYSNLCGLFAVASANATPEALAHIHAAITRTLAVYPTSYD